MFMLLSCLVTCCCLFLICSEELDVEVDVVGSSFEVRRASLQPESISGVERENLGM